jgi:hypothetical protein
MKKILLLVFGIILYLLLYCKSVEYFSDINVTIPKVEFPFKNLFDDKGKELNIILIAAPFREKKHEEIYKKYKDAGYYFCGISSYLNFPNTIDNPYEDTYHIKNNHDYFLMVTAWLHCFREPLKTNLPTLLLTEADLKNTSQYKPDPSINKEYDFLYCCLKDNDKCEPGWQSYNRNWELGKKCLNVMCSKFNMKGILVGRENCEYTDKCNGLIKVTGQLPFNEFQKELQKSKILFVPNITDASPRVITEALCYNIPVLVNRNILGGWHNVIPGVTGEFFTNEIDIIIALEKLTKNYKLYKPREWFITNRGKEKSGAILAQFLISNYPNINNKTMEYATITI